MFDISPPVLLLGTLVILILLRVPVVFAIGAAVCLYFVDQGLPAANIAVRMGSALDASVLMAIPLSVPVLNLLIPILGAATFTHIYHSIRRRAGPSG